MKPFLKFLAGFLQEESGKSSQKRAIVFIAMLLISFITYATTMLGKEIDYMLLASLMVIILFGIGVITRISEKTLDKILDMKKTTEIETKEKEAN